MTFQIRKGTNISHWLSQSKNRGDKRREWFTQEDVERIARFGFDHVRLPIDEEQMWDEQGKREPEAFDLLSRCLEWCNSRSLRVIVDLHILRSHHFNANEVPSLFTDPKQEARFGDLWRDLSDFLHAYPLDRVAYELMNEPVAEDANDWNRVARTGFNAVREKETERVILVGSNRWNRAGEFDKLWVPDDQNAMLTFHHYAPFAVTHYRASWNLMRDYSGPIQYPGQSVPRAEVEKTTGQLRTFLESRNRDYDREAMRRDFELPISVSRKAGLPLYCGEFGCIHNTPHEIRMRWYRDIISVFDEFNIAWGNWDYKGGFGIVNRDGSETGIGEALLGRKQTVGQEAASGRQ